MRDPKQVQRTRALMSTFRREFWPGLPEFPDELPYLTHEERERINRILLLKLRMT